MRIKFRWTYLLKACYTPDNSLILDGDTNKMSDGPFEQEKIASVFDNPQMSLRDGLFEAYHLVKDSHFARTPTIEMALNATTKALFARGNDLGGEIYET